MTDHKQNQGSSQQGTGNQPGKQQQQTHESDTGKQGQQGGSGSQSGHSGSQSGHSGSGSGNK